MTTWKQIMLIPLLCVGTLVSCGGRSHIGHALSGKLPLPITTFDEAAADSDRSPITSGEMTWTDFQQSGVQTCSYAGEQDAFERFTKIDGNAHFIFFNYIVPVCIENFDKSKYMLIFVVPYNKVGNLQLPVSFSVFNMKGEKITSFQEKQFETLGISVEVVDMTEEIGLPMFTVQSVEFNADLVLAEEDVELLRIQAGSSITF